MLPWVAALGITGWREVRASGHIPVPAALLGVTLLYAGLSVITEIVPGAARPVLLAAWGLNVAGLLNILPGGLYQQVSAAQKTEAAAGAAPAGKPVTGTGQAAGTTTAAGRGGG